MAESAIDRLKRVAAEKKAAAAAVAQVAAQPAEEVAGYEHPDTGLFVKEEKVDAGHSELLVDGTGSDGSNGNLSANVEAGASKTELEVSVSSTSITRPVLDVASGVASVSGLGDSVTTGVVATELPTKAPSNHPLAMQFAELEAALVARDPQFPTILRQIHRHLGQDAELVTQMTEEEIQLIVTGMVVYAQAEIVEPAKAKSAKAAVAKAKKAVITEDDL